MNHKIIVDMPFRGKLRRIVPVDALLPESKILREFTSDNIVTEHENFLRSAFYKASNPENGLVITYSSFFKKKMKVIEGASFSGIANLDFLLDGGGDK